MSPKQDQVLKLLTILNSLFAGCPFPTHLTPCPLLNLGSYLILFPIKNPCSPKRLLAPCWGSLLQRRFRAVPEKQLAQHSAPFSGRARRGAGMATVNASSTESFNILIYSPRSNCAINIPGLVTKGKKPTVASEEYLVHTCGPSYCALRESSCTVA